MFSIYRSKGRDERGVLQIRGWWDQDATIRCAVGAFVGLFTLYFAWLMISDTKHPWRWWLNLVMGIAFTYGFIHNVLMRRRIKKLSGAVSIGSRFGVDAERLTTFAEEQGIKPRYNINGEDFYDLKDFGDAAVLLRASVAPAAERETLLRPAAGSATPAENLLRPSAMPQAAQTETQPLTNERSDAP